MPFGLAAAHADQGTLVRADGADGHVNHYDISVDMAYELLLMCRCVLAVIAMNIILSLLHHISHYDIL